MEGVCWAIDWHTHHDPKLITSVFGVSLYTPIIVTSEFLKVSLV